MLLTLIYRYRIPYMNLYDNKMSNNITDLAFELTPQAVTIWCWDMTKLRCQKTSMHV